MDKTVLYIKDMDCPSEELMIRINLTDCTAIRRLDFDIGNRQLTIFHKNELEHILSAISSLNFGADIIETGACSDTAAIENKASDKKMLWAIFFVNFCLFSFGIAAGLIANSLGF